MSDYQVRNECAVCDNTLLQEVLNLNEVPLAGYFPTENQLEEISSFLQKKGETIVNINFCSKEDTYIFKLKDNRNIDRKSINLIRSKEINAIIS